MKFDLVWMMMKKNMMMMMMMMMMMKMIKGDKYIQITTMTMIYYHHS